MDKETFSPFRANVFIYSKFIIEIEISSILGKVYLGVI